MKTIKKQLILTLLLNLFVLYGLFAQQPQNRSISTIVADALAQLPADDPKLYKETFTSLISTGEEGLTNLIGMLRIPDAESNEAVEFAISGWTDFVANNKTNRDIAANTFSKALEQTLDNEVKSFLIRQLALVGNDGQVAILSKFTNNPSLSAPAIQTLVSIGTEKVNKALLQGLDNASTEEIRINLVNALAYTEYVGAENVLLKLSQDSLSEELNEVLLNALARTGTKISLTFLKTAAEKEDYSYQKNNATASYISLLKKLTTTNSKEVQKEANALLSKATKTNQQHLRVAAMDIQMSLPTSNKNKLLRTALKDENKFFLNSTLNYYSPHKDQKGITFIIKQLQKTNNADVKSFLIYWLGNQQITKAVSVISENLNSIDKNIQIAAIKSLAKIGNDEALKALISLLSMRIKS